MNFKNDPVSQNILGHLFIFLHLPFNSLGTFQKRGTGLRQESPLAFVGTGHLALRLPGLPSGEGSALFGVSQLP